MKDIRKECVKAVFDDFDQCGDAIRPAADLVDIVVDAINKEL